MPRLYIGMAFHCVVFIHRFFVFADSKLEIFVCKSGIIHLKIQATNVNGSRVERPSHVVTNTAIHTTWKVRVPYADTVVPKQ